MNRSESRLKEIQVFKKIYKYKLEHAESERDHELLEIQLNKLDKEEIDILKRCDAL